MNITSIMQIAHSIGKSTVEKMKKIGIDTVEKLASARIESLLVLEDIGIKEANKYIQFAKKHLERIKAKEKIYTIVKKGVDSNVSRSQDKANIRKSIDKKDKPNVPISWIKKLASSSLEDMSKLEGMGISNPEKYIEIAKKYLESMRTIEKEEDRIKEEIDSSVRAKDSIPQKQVLGFVQFDNKEPSKMITSKISPQQKKGSHLEKPHLVFKSIQKSTYGNKLVEKPKYKKPVKGKPETVDIKKDSELQTFFSSKIMQKIRFLHFKIKTLQNLVERNEDFSFSELNNIIEYIKILNVNYKTQSQIRIFKELEITPSFYDPIEKKEIKIWDLIFECSRVLWIAARAYAYLSNKFELENLTENAIVAMVESSKMYKTAAYFSAACTRQEDKGKVLSVENLELNSEESRIFAQNLATLSEERKENFAMAANLSSGLSALTKRLAFLREYDNIRENHFKAQYNYDMGRACHLKAKSLLKVSSEGKSEEQIENMQKKANYYYIKAEEIWESMLTQFITLKEPEKKSIKYNLSIVNENIIENDVEIINEKEALTIQDPEPLIIVPENLAPFIPRTTNFLTKYQQADLNFDAYRRYKNIISEVLINFNKIEELQNSKAGIGRTLKQLKILYNNNDIDINSFTELFEKYSIKLETIESAIQNLKNPESRTKITKEQEEILKSIM